MSNTSYTMPTLEEIELLQKGKLSPAREAEIKTLAKSNPLVAEALEGFAILPVFAAVPGAESFLNMVANAPGSAAAAGGAASSAAASTGATTTGAAVAADVAVKTAAWFGAKTLIIAGVSATVAITGTLIVVNENSEEAQQAGNSTTLVNPSAATEIGQQSPANASLNNSNDDQHTQEVENNTIGNQTIQYTDAAVLANPTSTGSVNFGSVTDQQNVEIIAPESLTTLPITTDPLTVQQDAATVGPRADISGKVMAIGIQTILHYKVADYTKVVRKDWPSFDADPGGVPAQFESEEAKRAAQQDVVTKEIPYLDYLTLCIRAMDHKDYDLALSHFNQVLDQYPDDVNGLFYSAQCHYYKGEYDQAIALYDKTMRNMINKFNEEAEFYKAKSLKALGKKDDARVLFESIIAKGKFYSQQAAKEIE